MATTAMHNTLAPDVETASDAYRGRFASPAGQYFLQVQTALVAELLDDLDSPLRVLEVGGGHGQLTPHLLDRGYEVWVHGSDARCDRQIRSQLMREPRLQFVSSSLWSLPFDDTEFDVVIGLRLMAHVEDWRGLLREMGRVSRRRVLIDYASAVGFNAFSRLLFGAKRRVEGNTRPFFCHRGGAVQAALRKVGFRVTGSRSQFFLPMAVHRLWDRPGVSSVLEVCSRGVGLTRLLGSPVLLRADREANGRARRGGA